MNSELPCLELLNVAKVCICNF